MGLVFVAVVTKSPIEDGSGDTSLLAPPPSFTSAFDSGVVRIFGARGPGDFGAIPLLHCAKLGFRYLTRCAMLAISPNLPKSEVGSRVSLVWGV